MNAEEAARAIGCSSKTVRRHLEKGTITASRKASGELKISDDQVEKLRLVLELEDTSRSVQPKVSVGRPDQADMPRRVETDIERRLASLAQSIANLNAAVDSQTRRITELTKRVAELEARNYPVIAENVPVVSTHVQPSQNTTPISKPQIASTEPNRDMLSVADFATQIGISYTVLDGYTRRGVRGEKLDVTEVPHPTRAGYTHKYFTIEQQKKALELLKKHGKLPDV